MWSLLVLAGGVLMMLRDYRLSGLTFVDWFTLHGARIYVALWHRWSANGPAPFPKTGPAIVISNHTCSADPSFLLAASPRTLSFFVAREHFRVHPLIGSFLDYHRCVPVIRTGADAVALRRGLRRLGEGDLVGVFPEGGLSGVGRERIRHPKLGMAYLALKTRAPVYPVYIAGGPRTDDLLSSWLVPSPRAVHINFGPAVDLSGYYEMRPTRRVIEEVAIVLMNSIKELRTNQRTR